MRYGFSSLVPSPFHRQASAAQIERIIERIPGIFATVVCVLLTTSITLADSPKADPANIAPTALTQPRATTHVIGSPRQTQGHPCTLWDQEDIEQIKKNLKASAQFQTNFNLLIASADKRLTQPLNVPAPDANKPEPQGYRQHGTNATDMVNLGIAYALTGQAKYGEYARQMLLAYARGYRQYAHPEGWTINRYRSALDGRIAGQFLDDGFWLCRVAFCYDLVYNLPAWTDADRQLVKQDLFQAICEEFYHPILREDASYVSGLHNRSALCMSGMLMAGYATENQTLVNIALYGKDGSASNIKGGLMGVHFSDQCIMPDGLWLEGAPAYQVGIASCGLFNAAETLWHHGIDMYRYNNAALKRLLDSVIGLAYPDSRISVAALRDSSRMALADERPWFAIEAAAPYECGYLRYGDSRYLPILRNVYSMNSLWSMSIHAGPPLRYVELPASTGDFPKMTESVNYHSVGYGVLRVKTPTDCNQVILEYGPSGSHGHPSKLGVDFYALGDALMPFPGVIFPYQDPRDTKWFWTTLSNCALTVDEQSQITWGNLWKSPRGTPNPVATQLVFAPATTVGMQRAIADNLYPQMKINQDRAVFLTADYLADLYNAFANEPHTWDLAWHFRAQLSMSLPLKPFQFTEPVANGYNTLTDVTAGKSDQAWTATGTTYAQNKPVKFFAPGGTPTDVITGKGLFFIKSTKPEDLEYPPTLILRRTAQKSVLFGGVTDVSGNSQGYVQSITQEGSNDLGYGLVNIKTTRGIDTCYVAYRAGLIKTAEFQTDAQQAFVSRDGPAIITLYLAGGTTLTTSEGQLTRTPSGLAYLEKLERGAYVLGNPSPVDARVTLRLPALDRLNAYHLDEQNQHTGAAVITRDASTHSLTVNLKAGQKIEFAP